MVKELLKMYLGSTDLLTSARGTAFPSIPKAPPHTVEINSKFESGTASGVIPSGLRFGM